MKRKHDLIYVALLVLVSGCPNAGYQTNPFLTLTETFGPALGGIEEEPGAPGGGGTAQAGFRQTLTITFQNFHRSAEANASFVAWVNASSIRSAEQQDALLADGYVQLRREVRIGTAYTLPVGTFVYDGGGTAGATAIRLGAATAAQGEEPATPATQSITLITPDVMLIFEQPPVSCESVAFVYSRNGEPLTAVPVAGAVGPYAGSNTYGGFKTLAQVDAYQCEPLRPGLFIKLAGGARQANEYFEGDDVTFDFSEFPDADGNFGFVTIGDGG